MTDLRAACLKANHDLVSLGLVMFTWGNASVVDRSANVILIKPSGIDYDRLTAETLVAVRLSDGVVLGPEGLRPSLDTPTHLALYRAWPAVGGIVHTHSEYATAHAQVERDLVAEGTTQADYFRGDVPCTRRLAQAEVDGDYEAETGAVIIEEFRRRGLDPLAVPGCLVAQHAPFTWGTTVAKAVYHGVVLERLARMAVHGRRLDPQAHPIPGHLLDRHYLRKHGSGAYYGQAADRRS